MLRLLDSAGAMAVDSWSCAPPLVEIHQLDCALPAPQFAARIGLESPSAEVFSAPVEWPKARTFGCILPDGRALLAGRPLPALGAAPAATTRPTGARRTRVAPPREVVRLEDRLAYLLQPPLEALLSAEALALPFEPFDYQFDGVAFLFPRKHAVLADEMGLGKTMQSITAIRLLAHSGQVRRVLLVCPKPLVTNWQRELSVWAPDLSVAIVEGNGDKRSWVWDTTEAVITIVNYETLVRDAEQIPSAIQPWDLVLLDEAQRIKNSGGVTSKVVRQLNRQRSWALTGTPIENSTDDLVGIFEFVSPGLLRPDMKPRVMGRAVEDIVLRRTKDEVLDQLPPKIFRDATLSLSPEQAATYARAEEEGVVQLAGRGAELTVRHVFELVLRLKQICNFDPVTGASSKLEQLEADLEECRASGRKAIVFSQWVQTITQLAERLQRFGPLEYHGRVPQNQRDAVLERFRTDSNSSVILMSYGAGSVGLNLQFASYVFLFDRWWNPAVEDQAINRAHRIGAAGPVTVTRFLTLGTIEQRIDEILAQKRELFESVFASNNSRAISGLTRDDLFNLFRLQTPRGPLAAAA